MLQIVKGVANLSTIDALNNPNNMPIIKSFNTAIIQRISGTSNFSNTSVYI